MIFRFVESDNVNDQFGIFFNFCECWSDGMGCNVGLVLYFCNKVDL